MNVTSFPVSAIDITQPPTQTQPPNPSPMPSPTTLPSSFYEACVADTIQTARESGTEPDISWCARWQRDDDGPVVPTPRPTTRPPTQPQRALTNSTIRTRAPLKSVVVPLQVTTATRQPTMAPSTSNYVTIMPRTTTQPVSVLMQSTISKILSMPPLYVATTRSPAPVITMPGAISTATTAKPSIPSATTSPALIPMYPSVVAFVHEDAWMRRGAMKILTLRNGKLTLEKLVPKDLSQIFVVDVGGQVRVLAGNGAYVQLDTINEWRFASRQLKGSFSMETREKKRLVYDDTMGSVLGSLTETGPSSGWFIVPLGRLSQ